MINSIGSPYLWAGFILFVLIMLALDLGVFHRKAHEVSFKEAFVWSIVWISLALLFNAGLFFTHGSERGMEFLTGYLIEKALSVDNIFIILVTFTAFAVPKAHQHRVLFWGILGALVFRAIFIIIGAALVQKFHWVMYIFGVILMVTGYKFLKTDDSTTNPQENTIYRLMKRFIPTTSTYRNGYFWVKENGRYFATPLFLVLLTVELSDILFAVESIPAIFAVTDDPFIVFTSNIFAILGMRSMYFMLAGFMEKFVYLKTGLALILFFVGLKIFLSAFIKVPILLSLGVIGFILTCSVLASWIKNRKLNLINQ